LAAIETCGDAVAYIRELGARRFYVQSSAGDGPSRVRLTRIVEGSRTKAEREGARLTVEAEAKYQRRRADADAGPTLRDYLADWLAALQRRIAAGERAPSTYTQYRQVVNATCSVVGDVRLRQLSAADLRRLEDEWRAHGRQRNDPRSGSGPGLTQARVAFRRSVLHVALHEAVVRELLPSNPVDRLGRDVSAADHSEQPRRSLTLDEARRALAALEEPRWAEWRLIWRTALLSGLRLGELRGLRRQDVELAAEDAQGGWLRVRQQWTRDAGKDVLSKPKGRKARDVPITPPLARTLRAHLAQKNAEPTRPSPFRTLQHDDTACGDELVFGDAEGRPFSDWRCRSALRGLMRELGMAPLTPHELRHSAATLNLAAGVPLSLVSWLLGHTTSAITQIYLHPMADVQQEAARRFGAYVEGEPPPETPK
jgi:integrase